ncbi:hypothetical protein [Streptomyces parvulus]|uniref:hypothetical protein n=1 Tax=Streptomyces parvulus TaxID=146923 RepID=UPI0033AD5B69
MLKREAHAAIAAVKSSSRQSDSAMLMTIRTDDRHKDTLLMSLRHAVTVLAAPGRRQ